jgi:hypothetical protein
MFRITFINSNDIKVITHFYIKASIINRLNKMLNMLLKLPPFAILDPPNPPLNANGGPKLPNQPCRLLPKPTPQPIPPPIPLQYSNRS